MAGKEEAAVLEHGLQNVLGLEKVPPGFESYMEMPRIAVDHILRDEDSVIFLAHSFTSSQVVG